MFNVIVDTILNERAFLNDEKRKKGVYLEENASKWIYFSPLNENEVEIVWKNGGFDKKRVVLKKGDKRGRAVFLEWKKETEKYGNSSKIVSFYEKNPEEFLKRAVLGQKDFRKITRTFEKELLEKIKENGSYEEGIRELSLFFTLKQFRVFLNFNSFVVGNSFNEEAVYFKKGDKFYKLWTPLQFKIILLENLDEKEKETLKREVKRKFLSEIKKKTDVVITGIERLTAFLNG